MTTNDEPIDQIRRLGARRLSLLDQLATVEGELRPLLPVAYEAGHFPTELERLTGWKRGQVRLIIDPGAAREGRRAHDPGREPKRPGRKPTKKATTDAP